MSTTYKVFKKFTFQCYKPDGSGGALIGVIAPTIEEAEIKAKRFFSNVNKTRKELNVEPFNTVKFVRESPFSEPQI